MFLTCVKSPKLLSNAVAGAILCAALAVSTSADAQSKKVSKGAEPSAAGAITVSDYEFNSFIAPDAIKRIHFPGGSPVMGKPVYLSGNRVVMLQFAKGADKPVQMVLELENESVVTVRVIPKSVTGVTYTLAGAKTVTPGASSGSRIAGEGNQPVAARGEDIELLKHLIANQTPPAGFDPVDLPRATKFDKFTVVPLAGWSDGSSKRVIVFSLVAAPGQTAVVAPPQFYRPGITAVMLDGDVVDDKNSPQLFVAEDLNDE